jgi:glutathione S-transferase
MTWERGGGQLRKPATAVGDGRRRAAPLTSANPWEETNMDKLYYASGTCALASHIALEEAGADYSAVRLDFKASQQQSPDYLKINPKGRVPALVTDKGILTETPAILAYIAQTFPKAKLAPTDDPFAFAQVQSFNNYLCATVHVAHAHKGRGYRWATDEQSFADMKRMVPKSMGACFALIENGMLRGPWVMGEQYTICDPYLYTISLWLEGDSVDLKTLPKVADHMKRMAERPAVKKVMGEQQAKAA